MTNKEYKPLTTGGYANPKMLQEYRDRLCFLEDCIAKGTLVFLPCKVGDEFWWIGREILPNILIKEIVTEITISEDGICIIDEDGVRWHLSEIFFTEEVAQIALEELEK